MKFINPVLITETRYNIIILHLSVNLFCIFAQNYEPFSNFLKRKAAAKIQFYSPQFIKLWFINLFSNLCIVWNFVKYSNFMGAAGQIIGAITVFHYVCIYEIDSWNKAFF